MLTSFVWLSSRPSLSVLFACAVVTLGFFIGVFLDGVNVSTKGVMFGVASSAITAVHAVVIKRAIELFDGNALNLAFYSSLLSAASQGVVVLVAGEVPRIVNLMTTSSAETFSTFLWGSFITVC